MAKGGPKFVAKRSLIVGIGPSLRSQVRRVAAPGGRLCSALKVVNRHRPPVLIEFLPHPSVGGARGILRVGWLGWI